MASLEFDSREERDIRRLALNAVGIKSTGSATSSHDARKRKERGEQVKQERAGGAFLRNIIGAGIFAAGGASTLALAAGAAGAVRAVNEARQQKGGLKSLAGRTAVGAAVIGAAGLIFGARAAEAERIQAFRRSRGRPAEISAPGEQRIDVIGLRIRESLELEERSTSVIVGAHETLKAGGQGFGLNSANIGVHEARRQQSKWRGSAANKILDNTISEMNDRFTREIDTGWKTGSRKGG